MNKDFIKRPDALTTDWVLGEISSGIDLRSRPTTTLTRGEQWKIWLDTGEKTSWDLIMELGKAPGKPKEGERIADFPVAYYEPGPVQIQAHHATEKTVLVSGGKRAGKSKWLAAMLLPFMFKSYAHLWLIGPTYDLAHDEFDYIEMWLRWLDVPIPKDPSKPINGPYSLTTKWNAKLDTMTGKDEDSIEMASLDAVGITEAGQTQRILMDRVRGRVSQKRGRIFLSGSPVEAQPWYINALKKYKNGDEFGDWHSFSIPSFDNKAVYPLGEADPEIQSMKRNLPEAEYARSVLAEPMPPEGLVFKEFNTDLHVVPITVNEIDPDKLAEAMQRAYSPFGDTRNSTLYPESKTDATGFKITSWEIPDFTDVELAIDPGWEHGYAVLACVIHKDTILVIDEVYEKETYGEDIIQICKDRPWWPRVKKGVIDRASKQHHEGMSEFEKWNKDAGIRLLTQFVPVPDGIARYRTFLINPYNGKPRLFIDPKCDRYIWEHSVYKYAQHKEDRPIRESPIDANNHAIKAMTYFMVVRMNWTDKTNMSTTSRKYIERRSIGSSLGVRQRYEWEESGGW